MTTKLRAKMNNYNKAKSWNQSRKGSRIKAFLISALKCIFQKTLKFLLSKIFHILNFKFNRRKNGKPLLNDYHRIITHSLTHSSFTHTRRIHWTSVPPTFISPQKITPTNNTHSLFFLIFIFIFILPLYSNLNDSYLFST